ncbi:MAG: hypothetical protein HY716_05510 [Planctomycetes bacterium]|nr:hypothetical protein [Planctomycetota bacterium]
MSKPKLTIETLEERIAPTITVLNPAGNSPSGGGALNGQNVDAYNPAGHTPPGQQDAEQGAAKGD